jgi:hypothetical protein
MKTKSLLVLSIVTMSVVVLISAGCKKYEDGPVFSLATKKARITNEWELKELFINGVEQAITNVAVRDIKRDGSYIVMNGSVTDDTGTWLFDSNKQSITFISNNYNDYTRKILRLKTGELWLEMEYGTDLYEYHYKKH